MVRTTLTCRPLHHLHPMARCPSRPRIWSGFFQKGNLLSLSLFSSPNSTTVKFTLEQATKAQRVGGKRHALASLPPEKDPVLTVQEDGCASGFGLMRKISPPDHVRSPDHTARSESLYRLRYSGPLPHHCTAYSIPSPEQYHHFTQSLYGTSGQHCSWTNAIPSHILTKFLIH